MKYVIKNPIKKDIPQLKALWETSFGDDKAYIDRFYSDAFAFDRCLIAKSGDEVCAAAHFFDGELTLGGDRRLSSIYLYALSTKPEHRGNGVMSELVNACCNYAAAVGYHTAALVPANEKLARFYEKLGFKTAFYRQSSVIAPSVNTDCVLRVCEKNEFLTMRREFIAAKKASFELTEKVRKYSYDLFEDNVKCLFYNDSLQSGYLVAEISAEKCDIIESSLPLKAQCKAAYAINREYKTSSVTSPISGRRRPYGMVKALTNDISEYDIAAADPYMNLMLE